MSIVISIIKLPENVANTKSTHTFAHSGGTIGRGADNDWVIEDDECFISSKHSQISYENGHFYITDLSTNGTFANGSAEPIGKGNTVKLNDGDKFSLGDYEFLASVWQPDVKTPAVNQGPFADSNPDSIKEPNVPSEDISSQDYFASASSISDDGFASGFSAHISNTDSLFSPDPIQTDPLAALDNSRQIPGISQFNSDNYSSLSHSDQATPMQHAVDWPTATADASVIPEDWEKDIFGVTLENDMQNDFALNSLNKASSLQYTNQDDNNPEDKKSALEKANEKILAEIEILKKDAQRQALKEQILKNTKSKNNTEGSNSPQTPTNRKATPNENSLIEAIGLGSHDLPNDKVIEINLIVGELVRETVKGMMQVLSSRSSIKNEFRMNVTTIQPVENNPLKFSANIDDAIENMFLKDGNAYKKPVEAIKEGFEGIAEHQIAILAGIRTAFKGVLNRFDPVVLEQRFEKFNKSGLIPGMSKSKNWDSYTHYYKEIVDDMDSSFQHLFGYEFVQAYEDQLQKLSIARKSKKNSH